MNNQLTEKDINKINQDIFILKNRAHMSPNAVVQALVDISHLTSFSKGWWEEQEPKAFIIGTKLQLITSELCEAFEEVRNGRPLQQIYYSHKDGRAADVIPDGEDPKDWKPEGFPIELADALIRTFDLIGMYEVPIYHALMIKFEYNLTRKHRHGGRSA